MIPTHTDLAFYQYKHHPKWAQVLNQKAHVSIDSVVNSHIPPVSKRAFCSEPHNTMAILQSVNRRQGVTLEYLHDMFISASGTNPKKRRAFILRIMARLKKGMGDKNGI